MSAEDQIAWVTVTFNFSPEEEVRLEKQASDSGLSLKCYCDHILHKHLLEDASAVQQEQWQREFPATLAPEWLPGNIMADVSKGFRA